MNLQETDKLLTIIQKSYRRFFNEFDPESHDVQVKIWQRSLADFSLKEALTAFEVWVNTSQYPPSLAEFKPIIIKSKNPNVLISPERAWETVSEAVRRFGSHNQEKAFEAFTEPMKRAVRNVGGWQKICSTELGEKWDFLRKDFMKSYSDFETDNQEQYLLPPDTLRRIQELRQIEEQKQLQEPDEEAQ